VGDLAAEVEDVDVARGEVCRDVCALVVLAFGDEHGGRLGGEACAEVVCGGMGAGEAGHGARRVVVAGDGDALLAADDHAHVGLGHGRHVAVFLLAFFFFFADCRLQCTYKREP
jgi:hypothetical protein